MEHAAQQGCVMAFAHSAAQTYRMQWTLLVQPCVECGFEVELDDELFIFPVVPHGAKRECRLVSSSVLDRDCVFRTDDGNGQHMCFVADLALHVKWIAPPLQFLQGLLLSWLPHSSMVA